jgi:hypothetical protein
MPSAADADTLQAIFAGVQEAIDAADREWGAGRLELLVPDVWRAKLYAQKRKWSVAYAAAWGADVLTRDMLAEVEEHAGGMKRAFVKLGELATEAGHRPIAPWVWETTLADGSVLAVVQTDAEVARVIAEGRHVAVYTLREVANVIDALPEALAMAKVVWPGAQILPQSAAGPFNPRVGDAIPFGDAA